MRIKFHLLLTILLIPTLCGTATQGVSAQARRKSAQIIKELNPHFRDWLEHDVVYIISPEEQDVFLKLTTDEERDQFIEQFWARRDPDPGTPQNESKEEHYRRIQHANDHFQAGIPGWRTDRGRIYISFGPPDRMETHPVGGQYIRPGSEGGGMTSTFPFEKWEYRHIEGVGDDIEIEFVDVSGGNLYELTTDPFKKDEFLTVPGMGLTDREMFPAPGDDPVDMRRARVLGLRDAGSASRMGIGIEGAKNSPFGRTELAANLSKPPVIHFKDLQEKVTARISYNALPVNFNYHFVRLSDSDVLVPLVMSVPNKLLTFIQEGELVTNRLQVYGRITSLTGSVVYEFDDEIMVSYSAVPGRSTDAIERQQTLYRRPLALRPGRFKLDTVIREASSGHMGTAECGIVVPNLSKDDKLKLSPLVLAAKLDRLRNEKLINQDHLTGQFRVLPRVDAAYRPGEYVAFYFEIYDYSVDQTTNAASLKVEYAIAPKGNAQQLAFRDISRGILAEGDRVMVPRQVSLAPYAPGSYELHVRVTDTISGHIVKQSASFNIQ